MIRVQIKSLRSNRETLLKNGNKVTLSPFDDPPKRVKRGHLLFLEEKCVIATKPDLQQSACVTNLNQTWGNLYFQHFQSKI